MTHLKKMSSYPHKTLKKKKNIVKLKCSSLLSESKNTLSFSSTIYSYIVEFLKNLYVLIKNENVNGRN